MSLFELVESTGNGCIECSIKEGMCKQLNIALRTKLVIRCDQPLKLIWSFLFNIKKLLNL